MLLTSLLKVGWWHENPNSKMSIYIHKLSFMIKFYCFLLEGFFFFWQIIFPLFGLRKWSFSHVFIILCLAIHLFLIQMWSDGIKPCFSHRGLKPGKPDWYTTKNNCPLIKEAVFLCACFYNNIKTFMKCLPWQNVTALFESWAHFQLLK